MREAATTPGADAGLGFLREALPRPQLVWLRRADKVRQGVSGRRRTA